MNPNPNAPGSIPQRFPHIPAALAALMGWGFTDAMAIAAVIF